MAAQVKAAHGHRKSPAHMAASVSGQKNNFSPFHTRPFKSRSMILRVFLLVVWALSDDKCLCYNRCILVSWDQGTELSSANKELSSKHILNHNCFLGTFLFQTNFQIIDIRCSWQLVPWTSECGHSVTNNRHFSSKFGERILVWKICCFDVKNIFPQHVQTQEHKGGHSKWSWDDDEDCYVGDKLKTS